MKPEISGDFSISDLLREAAVRSIDISHVEDVSPVIDTPTMSGTLKTETIRNGLLMSGYDLACLADFKTGAKMCRSIFCGLLLDGGSAPLTIDGGPAIDHKPQCVEVLGFGEPVTCRRF